MIKSIIDETSTRVVLPCRLVFFHNGIFCKRNVIVIATILLWIFLAVAHICVHGLDNKHDMS